MLQQSISVLSRLLGRTHVPSDNRNHRFVAVIECTLNQNARDAGAACFPAMNFELVQLCCRHGVGILQMPCPEIAALGCGRERRPGQSLRQALDGEAARCRCAALAEDVASRIADYIAGGCQLLAVLGGNPLSPGCAVHAGPDRLNEASGVFMHALQAELRRRGCDPLFRGMRDHDPDLLREDLAWLRERFARP